MEDLVNDVERGDFRGRGRHRWVSLLKYGMAIGVLGFAFGPGLAKHVRNAADPFVFAEDARIHIWPLLHYQDPGLFSNDYTCRYLLDCAPAGHTALFRIWGAWFDVRTMSKALPYALLAIVLVCVALAAEKLGGGWAAWCAVAFCLASDVFMARMTGGLPRAFAYPLVSVSAAALVLGRPYWVVSSVLIGAAFYPVVAVIAGLSLAVYLLFLPSSERGGAAMWPLKKRCAVVMLTGAGAVLIVSLTVVRCGKYGALLRPGDVQQYPELGAGGRWELDSRAPFPGFVAGSAREAWRFFADPHRAWIREADRKLRAESTGRFPEADISALLALAGAIGIGTAIGFSGLIRKEPAARRLLALVAGTFAGHVASRQLAPYFYLPQRYLAYTIPILAVLAFPAAISWLSRRWIVMRRRPWARAASVVLVCGVCMLCLGQRDGARRGYSVNASREAELYSFLASLPADSLIAGWPDGVMQNVSYLSARPAFVTQETHLVFHRGFADEMRRRTRALVTAYFAPTIDALIRLRDEFGVTHLVIDTDHYSGTRASYFKPFDLWVDAAYMDLGTAKPEALRRVSTAAVFQHGPLAVIDMRRLPGGAR